MSFSITSPDQIIKLEMVEAGCAEIDQALDMQITMTNRMLAASDLLGPDSLLFGDASNLDASFADGLTTLASKMDKFQANSEGITASIRAKAQAQYEEEWAEYNRYLAWLEEQEELERRKGR